MHKEKEEPTRGTEGSREQSSRCPVEEAKGTCKFQEGKSRAVGWSSKMNSKCPLDLAIMKLMSNSIQIPFSGMIREEARGTGQRVGSDAEGQQGPRGNICVNG